MAQGNRFTKTRRKTKTRRTKDQVELDLVRNLRMQARARAAANQFHRVEPSTPEKFLEWQGADLIEELLAERTQPEEIFKDLSTGIVQVTKKLKLKEAEALGDKTEVVSNLKSMKADWHQFLFDDKKYTLFNDNIKKLGKPNCTMRGYDSVPGMWLFDDTLSGARFVLYSDCHRKNAFKGTSFEVIATDANENISTAFSRFVKYVEQL